MTAAVVDIFPDEVLAARPPGFLLAPLGWAAERLVLALWDDPALLAEVIHLGRCRMHLIALALAHRDEAIPREFAETLLRGSAGKILDAVLDHRPVGLRRAVQRLPHRVIGAAGYRRLVQLLDDPAAAKLLHSRLALWAAFPHSSRNVHTISSRHAAPIPRGCGSAHSNRRVWCYS